MGPMSTDQSTGPARDLVVSYCFPPYVDTAAIVAAKRVRETGRPVDVIHNAMGRIRPTDARLAEIAGPLVQRRHEVPTLSMFASWRVIVPWVDQGLEQALAWDRQGPGYERLYSRAQFSASHILAARIKIARPGVRWTAEFSDPLSHDVRGALRYSPVLDGPLIDLLAEALAGTGYAAPGTGNVYEWAEVLPYALADEILFTNEHQRDLMMAQCAQPALRERILERARIAPHPTLGPEFYAMAEPELDLEPGRAHIGYFGNFYPTRGMGTVIEALTLLRPDQRDRVHLHVFANSGEELEEAVAKKRLGDVVTVRPFLDYPDFLAMTRRMDVLLVNDAETSADLPENPFLPSKWSDYRGSGSAVWGIVEPGSTLDGQDLTYRSPVAHTTAALQVLSRIADDVASAPRAS